MFARIYSLDELRNSPELMSDRPPWWIHFLLFLVVTLVLLGGTAAAQRIRGLYVKTSSDHPARIAARYRELGNTV
jgi:hypothetical protein